MFNLPNFLNRPSRSSEPVPKGTGETESFLQGELAQAKKELAGLLAQSDRDETKTGALRERISHLEKSLGKTETTPE